MLVAPVVEKGAVTKDIYLPKGKILFLKISTFKKIVYIFQTNCQIYNLYNQIKVFGATRLTQHIHCTRDLFGLKPTRHPWKRCLILRVPALCNDYMYVTVIWRDDVHGDVRSVSP